MLSCPPQKHPPQSVVHTYHLRFAFFFEQTDNMVFGWGKGKAKPEKPVEPEPPKVPRIDLSKVNDDCKGTNKVVDDCSS